MSREDLLDAPFPLTPALSPGERVTRPAFSLNLTPRSQASANGRKSFFGAHIYSLPSAVVPELSKHHSPSETSTT
jgi:hypothetical protein